MNEYATAANFKAIQAIRDRNWNRASRCISILCDLRNQADIAGYRNCDWFPQLVQ